MENIYVITCKTKWMQTQYARGESREEAIRRFCEHHNYTHWVVDKKEFSAYGKTIGEPMQRYYCYKVEVI